MTAIDVGIWTLGPQVLVVLLGVLCGELIELLGQEVLLGNSITRGSLQPHSTPRSLFFLCMVEMWSLSFLLLWSSSPLEPQTQVKSFGAFCNGIYHTTWKGTNIPWKHEDLSLDFQVRIKAGHGGVPCNSSLTRWEAEQTDSPWSSWAIWQSSKPVRSCS